MIFEAKSGIFEAKRAKPNRRTWKSHLGIRSGVIWGLFGRCSGDVRAMFYTYSIHVLGVVWACFWECLGVLLGGSE